ncbi:MAG: hypothetical protein FJY97_11225 [candidate division Zixibacteria bacterium]|nr:hypothetical protein [candidate division Zixibacteria bacterium]
MELQHLCVKRHVRHPDHIDLGNFLTIFNEWIQEEVGEELLIDVADYRHVPDGPGVVLVGHEATYSMDGADGRLGLLYSRKTVCDGSAEDRATAAMHSVLAAGNRLCKHPRLSGKLEFDDTDFLIIVNDRLLAPNTENTFENLADTLRPVLGAFFADFSLSRAWTDPRKRLAARVAAPGGLKTVSGG